MVEWLRRGRAKIFRLKASAIKLEMCDIALNEGDGMKKLLLAISIVLVGVAQANTTLLEACNAIDNKGQRLACLKELSDLKGQSTPDKSVVEIAAKKVKDTFSSVAGAVNSGISYSNYSALILEPAKELEIFKRSITKPNQNAVDQFEKSLVAYRDAARVWHASIFESSDGGMFLGKILNPQYTGLQGIVSKYGLPVKQIVLTQHLSAEVALPIIWRIAAAYAQTASEALDQVEVSAPVAGLWEREALDAAQQKREADAAKISTK